MIDLDNFDFIGLYNRLSTKSDSRNCLPDGKIRIVIDNWLYEQGIISYSVFKTINQNNYKEHFRSAEAKTVFKVLSMMMSIGVISYSHDEDEDVRGYQKSIKYYKINDNRNHLELISDMMPNCSKDQCVLMLSILNDAHGAKEINASFLNFVSNKFQRLMCILE